MGCAQSKIENEEPVLRCKERKTVMKTAVSSRNAFAAAHSSYVMALKNIGAALNEYGQSVLLLNQYDHPSPAPSSSSSNPPSSASVVKPPIRKLPPAPPPLPPPNYFMAPLQRSASMPDLPLPKISSRRKIGDPDAATIHEEDGDLEDDEEVAPAGPSNTSPVPPPPLPPSEKVARPNTPPPSPPEDKGAWDFFIFPQTPTMTDSMGEIRTEKEEEVHHFHRAVSPASGSDGIADGGGDTQVPPPMTLEKVVVDNFPPPPPPSSKPLKKPKQTQHASSFGGSEIKRGKTAASSSAPSINLAHILVELDNHFLKVSEGASSVSKMLEATRMHYHSNFADNRGHIDHSARVMKVITWNRSFKDLSNHDRNDDFDDEESETHATVLDKLLAWEKKLYDEVKAGESMKIKYHKKVEKLNRQKKRGVKLEVLEQTKAAVSHLHTRYIVDMQSMDSTVSEIQRLRDCQLYPKLVVLVDGMAKMWETMHVHHDSQLKLVMDLRKLDISSTPTETSDQHGRRTSQLYAIAIEWQSQFQKLVDHQKEYIQALNSWLKLNLIPIESNIKDKVSSPLREQGPPIQALVIAWHDQLQKLPSETAKITLSGFAAVINSVMVHQQEELRQKEKWEAARREYLRKERHVKDQLERHNSRRKPTDRADGEGGENASQNDQSAQKFELESLKKSEEEEEENYRKLCKQVREKSVVSLKTHFPNIFSAISKFSLECSEMYKSLRAVAQRTQIDRPS